jgi:hypothetical protein
VSFRITETLEGTTTKRSSEAQARCLMYDALIRMVHDNTQLGREVRKVQKWDGKSRLIIRYGKDFVTLES